MSILHRNYWCYLILQIFLALSQNKIPLEIDQNMKQCIMGQMTIIISGNFNIIPFNQQRSLFLFLLLFFCNKMYLIKQLEYHSFNHYFQFTFLNKPLSNQFEYMKILIAESLIAFNSISISLYLYQVELT
ncbi:unnamed protein product [Paramecium primaurelia]|uniref:Transmembrane protein n=1 Tax=Paramecium primaurelia TaxID=5886 RepID=A0A8S1Q8T7_PARPR|nr:unnamed protein product [Paramecium primaurelia]